MTGLTTFALSIPDSSEFGSLLNPLVHDVRAAERKISRQVNVENERKRLIKAHQRIDGILLEAMADQSINRVRLSNSFYPLLVRVNAQKTTSEQQILAGFLLADDLSKQILLWETDDSLMNRDDWHFWVEFCRETFMSGNGVFLWHANNLEQKEQVESISLNCETQTFLSAEDIEAVFDDNPSSDRVQETLNLQFEAALLGKCAINLSNQPHNVITNAMHTYIYKKKALGDGKVDVVYTDGSSARPLQLGLLYERNNTFSLSSTEAVMINAGLMSMRHQGMDMDIDLAWFRNCEVSKSRTLALSDEYCYQESLRLLEQLAAEFSVASINLFQTGFQPAVVGFYRAYAQMKAAGQIDDIAVIPYFYNRGTYCTGEIWY